MAFNQKIIKESTALPDKQLFGIPTENRRFVLQKSKIPLLGAIEQSIGVFEKPSFLEQVATYYADPLIQQAVNAFTERVLSTGIYISGNLEYNVKPNGMTAIELIKKWCDENNLNVKLVNLVTQLRAFGNSFFRLTDDGFIEIPIESIWKAEPINSTTELQQRYNLVTTAFYGNKVLEWGSFLHFRINSTGYKAPFGLGMMYGLLANPVDSFGRVMPSIYDINLSMKYSMKEGFEKFSFGNVWLSVIDMSNEDFDTSGLTELVEDMSPFGNRVISNYEFKVALEVPQRTQSYDAFIENMRNEYIMSLGEPSLKIGLEEGFTKATAEVAEEMDKSRVSMYRLTIKQQLEDVFKQILEFHGYDSLKANITLNFAPTDTPKYEVKDIKMMCEPDKNGERIITIEEARYLLSTQMHWDLLNGYSKKDDNLLDTNEIKQYGNSVAFKVKDGNNNMPIKIGEPNRDINSKGKPREGSFI